MEESKNPIQVADRLFAVMELLAEEGPSQLTELCRKMDLHKSTAHRLLTSLIHMGYAKQDPQTGKYGLTFKIVEIADKILSKVDVLEIVRPYLRKLMEQTGETVHFVQLDANEAVYIDKEESQQNSVRMVSKVGSRIPIYCSGVGKAMAACMTEDEVKQIWESSAIQKRTRHTITDYNSFWKKLEEIKTRGYALDDEENEVGVRCIAAALMDCKGKPTYAFSISAPVQRMTDRRIKELSVYVLQAKEKLQSQLA